MPNMRLSAWVAQRCHEADFQRFLGVTSERAAADAVRARCGVASRSEFDHDPGAEARLHEIIRRPFVEYQEAQCTNSPP